MCTGKVRFLSESLFNVRCARLRQKQRCDSNSFAYANDKPVEKYYWWCEVRRVCYLHSDTCSLNSSNFFFFWLSFHIYGKSAGSCGFIATVSLQFSAINAIYMKLKVVINWHHTLWRLDECGSNNSSIQHHHHHLEWKG